MGNGTWLQEVFSVKTPELRVVPVVAAMHATFERNQEDARAFWEQVKRGGKEFEDNAPSTVLDEWLRRQKTDDALDLKNGQYFDGCIYAWNAYREGKSIKTIRYDARKAAQNIAA